MGLQHHLSALELRRSSPCLGAEGTWPLCATGHFVPEFHESLLTGSGGADSPGSHFLVPDSQQSPLSSRVAGEPSVLCVGINVPGVAGQCSVQRPVLMDKLKPTPTWAGERKALSLIKNIFLLQV